VVMQSETAIQETTEVPPTPIPAIQTQTPFPKLTPSSTTTPTKEVTTPVFSSFAQSNVAAQERGAVVVEIAYILVGDKQAIEQDIPDDVMINSNILEDRPVLIWLVFNITNNSGKGFHLHPRRGTVLINDEIIDLSEYESYTNADDYFDGTYAPGEKVIGGGVWFGIKHSAVDEINEIIIRMHGPHFYEEDVYAKEYYIVLDLSDHVVEEIPDYLK